MTVFRLHGVFSGERLGQFGHMIECAQAGQPVKPIQGAGGEYAHLADVLRVFPLAMVNPKAYGEVFNVAGVYTYRDSDLAHFIVEQVDTGIRLEPVEDRAQQMVSVSVDKLSQLLGYKPERGEFLTQLIASALGQHRANRKESQ